MVKHFSLCLAVLFSLVLAGCGGGGSSPSTPPPPPPPAPSPAAPSIAGNWFFGFTDGSGNQTTAGGWIGETPPNVSSPASDFLSFSNGCTATVMGTVTAPSTVSLTLTPNSGPNITLSGTVQPNASGMNGTFSESSSGCAGGTNGTWAASPVASITGTWVSGTLTENGVPVQVTLNLSPASQAGIFSGTLAFSSSSCFGPTTLNASAIESGTGVSIAGQSSMSGGMDLKGTIDSQAQQFTISFSDAAGACNSTGVYAGTLVR